MLASIASGVERPRFDSGSVVPNKSGDLAYSFRLQSVPQPIQLKMHNVPLIFCLQQAYSLTAKQIFGPGWIKTARYDVAASMPSAESPEQVWTALQFFLGEHFQMTLERETKVMPVYALTVAKGGAKLRPSTGQTTETPEGPEMDMPSGRIRMNNATTGKLCESLSRRASRLVIDETGILGSFDFDLVYYGGEVGLFSALQKQLGLRMEARSAPVEILTVKRAQKMPL